MMGGSEEFKDKDYYNKKYYLNQTTSVASNMYNKLPILKADTGETKNYLKLEHKPYLHSTIQLNNGPTDTLQKNKKIKASREGIMKIDKQLNKQETKAFIYPGLTNE